MSRIPLSNTLSFLFPERDPRGKGESPDIPGNGGFPHGMHPAGGQDGGGQVRGSSGVKRMLFRIPEEQDIAGHRSDLDFNRVRWQKGFVLQAYGPGVEDES